MTPRVEFIASLDTKVAVRRSVDHIRALVERFGATEFSIHYDPATGIPTGVAFKVRDPRLKTLLPIALRAPGDVIAKLLLDRRPYPSEGQRTRIAEQADRVAWRNLHDFVRASLIGVQTGIMSLGEAFMASVVVSLPGGEARRMGDLIADGRLIHADQASGRLLLGPGPRPE